MLKIARKLSPLAAVAATAIVAAPALASTVTSSSGGLSASMHAGTHHPKPNKNWWITVTATLGGRPVQRAAVTYQFLYNGTVVSTQYVKYDKNYRFNGSFRDNLVFPARAEGHPLTLRVVISDGGHSVYLPYAIQVVK